MLSRVERALDKLQALLARRGIRSSAGALSAVLAAEAAVVAPAGLAGAVTTAALGGVAGAAGAAGGFMSMITWQVGVTGALALAGVTGWVVQETEVGRLARDVAALRAEGSGAQRVQAENASLRRLAVEVGELRRDDGEFARLQQEAGELRVRAQAVARAEEAARRQRLYELRMLDQTPRPTLQRRPEYPAALRSAGVSGEVVVEFVVGADGTVRDARALRSTQREFEAPAVEAVQAWTFAPGRKGGEAVATKLQMPIVFSLAGAPAGGAGAKPPEPMREVRAEAPREVVRAAPFTVEGKAP